MFGSSGCGSGAFYSSYHHFGVTNLRQNFIGNQITLESLVYGLALGCTLAGVAMWMSCVYAVFSADKVVYLLGRVSPRLSLFLSLLLRLVPEMWVQARKIHVAQQGIGRGLRQGNILRRLTNGLRIFSILITWTVEALAAASESMRSRGSGRKGRTAFFIYRFDNRDRGFVMGLFTCLTVVWMGVLLGQTRMRYNPRIMMNPVTPVSWVFFGAYACYVSCLSVWRCGQSIASTGPGECCCGGNGQKGWFWEKKVRVRGLSVVLLAVAVLPAWEIHAGYHQADQVYQDTAAQVIHTESKLGLLRTRLHGLGKSRNGLPPFLWDFCCLAAGKSGCGGMDLLPRYRDPIPSGSGEDNEHYLSRMIDGTYNSAGTIFLDCRCDGSFQSSNSILYGHNMQDDSMFGTLSIMRNRRTLRRTLFCICLTPEVDYEVQLLAGLHVPLDDEIYETDWTEWDLQDYLRDIIERSDFDSGASYTDAERILTLSTCGAGSRDTRYVLIGAMTELDRRETPRVAAE